MQRIRLAKPTTAKIQDQSLRLIPDNIKKSPNSPAAATR